MTNMQILAPDIYGSFSCKCGDCRHVCCRGWKISLSMPEYFRLLGADCSRQLRLKLDSAFHLADMPTRESYAIVSPDYDGKCRLVDGQGYCGVQRELGENAIPAVCRLYPRSIKTGATIREAALSCGCERTIELLMEEKTPLSILPSDVLTGEQQPEDMGIAFEGEKAEICRACVTIMREGNAPVSGKIKSIGEQLIGDAPSVQPDIAFGLKTVRDLILEFGRSSANMDEFGIPALETISLDANDPDYEEAAKLYAGFSKRVREIIDGYDRCWANIFVNHLFYEQFPFIDGVIDRSDAYRSLTAAYAIAVFISTVNAASFGTPESFVDSTAAAFRLIEHSDFYHTAARHLRHSGEKAPSSLLAL